MKYLIRQYFIYALSAHVVTLMVSSFRITGNWKSFLFAILVLTILFFLVKPIVNILFFPVHLLTLNLSSWIINVIFVYVWTVISRNVIIGEWNFPGLSLFSLTLSPVHLGYWISVIVVSFLLVLVIHIAQWIFS